MPSCPTSAPRRSVLYVEDDAVNALLMSAFFEFRPDLRLVIAESGQDALQRAGALDPALLLLDLRLPDCHGAELLPRLRRLPGYATPPAVAVTAESSFDHGAAGFAECWHKPLDLELLLRRLDTLLASGAATAEVGAHAGFTDTRRAGPSRPHVADGIGWNGPGNICNPHEHTPQ